MRQTLPRVLLSLLRSGSLAAGAYLLFGGSGPAQRALELNLSFWALPLYLLAGLLLASDLVRLFGRVPWAQPVALVLSRLGFSLVSGGLLLGLASVGRELVASSQYASWGARLRPYLDHAAVLGPWTALAIAASGAYRAFAPWWVSKLAPEPGPQSVRYIPKDLVFRLTQSGVMMGATYLLLHQEGVIALATGADLSSIQPAIFVLAAALFMADSAATFGRGLWRYSTALVMKGVAWAFLAVALIGGAPSLGEALSQSRSFSALGEALDPYLLHLSVLGPWAAAYVLLTTLYYIASVYLVRPRFPEINRRLSYDREVPVRLLRRVALGAAAVFLLLNQGGLFHLAADLDLSSLELPAYVALALFLVAGLLRLVALGEWTRVTSTLLSGSAWAILSESAFRSLPLYLGELEKKEALAALARYLSPYADHTSSLRLPSAALILAVTAYRVSEPYIVPRLERRQRPGIASPVRAVVSNALIAAMVYLLLHPQGYLRLATALDLGLLQAPFYAFGGMRLAGDLAGFFGRGLWRYGAQIGLGGAARALLAFALFRDIPYFLEELSSNATFASIGQTLDPYLRPLTPLAIWFTGYIAMVSIYHASAVYWNRERYPWAYLRLGHDEAAPVLSLKRSALLALAAYLVLNSSGLLALWTQLQLPFLAPPLYALSGMLLASSLVELLGAGLWRQSISTFLFWTGLAQLAYFVLHSLPRIGIEVTGSPAHAALGEVVLPYLVVLGGLDLWAAAFLELVAVYRAGSAYWTRAQGEPLHPLISALTTLLLGGIAWGALGSLASVSRIYSGLGAIAFGAFAVVSLGHLAVYVASHPNPLLRMTSGWAAASRFRNAVLGVFIALYAIFLRPALYTTFVYAPLLEWLGVAVLCLYILERTAGTIGKRQRQAPRSVWWHLWQRHRQEVLPLPDAAFDQVVAVQETFLDYGARPVLMVRFGWRSWLPSIMATVEQGAGPVLMVRVATALAENNVPLDKIAETISPLVHHADPVPSAGGFLLAISPPSRARFRATVAQKRHQALLRTGSAVEELRPLLAGFFTPRFSPGDGWQWAQEAFVQRGGKAELAAAVIAGAWQLGAARQVIAVLVNGVLEHRDVAPHWYSLPRARRRLEQQNLQRRQSLVDDLQRQMEYVRQGVQEAGEKRAAPRQLQPSAPTI